MTKRRTLLQRQQQLGEITSIINAMKNLAVLETRKLGQRLENLQAMLLGTETLVADFFKFSPVDAAAPDPNRAELWILFGSERGFCGDFNEVILESIQHRIATTQAYALISVGSRLHSVLTHSSLVNPVAVPGASLAEEIVPTLTRLMESVAVIESGQGGPGFQLSVMYHDHHSHKVVSQRLLPLAIEAPSAISVLNQPPHLYLSPDMLHRELIHHYLFVALQEIAVMSLMAENQHRIQHMEGAAQHLEKDLAALSRRYRQLRQEEITEEIELIALNAFGDSWGATSDA